jgi:alpha-ribazole phosphatase
MTVATNLWLVRHAPVDGPRGVIHGPDAPAGTSDAAAFALLKAKLPSDVFAVCSPARRTWETAVSLGLDAVRQPLFREQDFGAWTGRRHADLAAELGDS